jgi:hypothetical protein
MFARPKQNNRLLGVYWGRSDDSNRVNARIINNVFKIICNNVRSGFSGCLL